MKSAQLAILAFYAKNSDYYEAVASGQEVVKNEEGEEVYVGMSAHCHSARNFGMVTEEEFKRAVAEQDPDLLHSIALRRKKSKGASFGVVFGCAAKKLALMLGISEEDGEVKRNTFFTRMGLQGIIDWGTAYKETTKRGKGFYIPLPFGYWAWCNSPHKIINYLCQGCEAVAQKVAVNYAMDQLEVRGLTQYAWKVLDYHDEWLAECVDGYEEEVGKLMCEAYEYASNEIYDWYIRNPDRFPNEGTPDFAFNLDGGYKVSELGKLGNYLQTH